jgi:hypothetical protein
MNLLSIPHNSRGKRVYHQTDTVNPRGRLQTGVLFWVTFVMAVAALVAVVPDRSSAANLDVIVESSFGGPYFAVNGNYGKRLDLRVYASKTRIHFRSINRQHRFIKNFDPQSNDPNEANLRLCRGYSSPHLVCPTKPFVGSQPPHVTLGFNRNEGGRISGFSDTSTRCSSQRSRVSFEIQTWASSLRRTILTGNLSDEVELLGKNSRANTCGGADSLQVLERATGHAGKGDDAFIEARGRGSRVFGDAGDDSPSATRGAIAFGNGGRDNVSIFNDSRGYGGTGNDFVSEAEGFQDANFGRTRLFGGPGNDRLNSGGGTDFLNGGSGNDLLEAGTGSRRRVVGGVPYSILTPKARDILVGGSGRDRSLAGRNSILRSVERPKWLPVWMHPIYGQVPDPR